MRVLYIEDEKYLAEAVIHLLGKAKIEVDWVDNGEEGLDKALQPVYDVIVLDIMLPKMSGLEVLEAIRKRGIKTPIIMLSALAQVEDKIRGLEYGADDYLAKPFKTAELVARLNALVRRPPLQEKQIIRYGDLEYDKNERTLNGAMLTEKEAKILELLLKHPEQIQKKEAILVYVWGQEANNDDNYVEVYISYLRKKLKNIKSQVKIKTVRNLGYKLCKKD